MKLRRNVGASIAVVLAATTVGLASTSPASAQDIGRLSSSGTCGDNMSLRVRNSGDPIGVTITIPSADPTEKWSLTVTQQNYSAVTGGRIGDPVDITNSFQPLAFNPGGFVLGGGLVNNTEGLTHGISYIATRTSPSPITCTNTNGFWTNPIGTGDGPVAGNPTTRPDTPPQYALQSEADVGTNDVLLLMDQEMLDNGLGIPATNRFMVKVNNVAQQVTAVQVFNDNPPNLAVLDLTLATAIPSGATVTTQYLKPLLGAQAALQDLEGLKTASFGPNNISVLDSAGPLAQRIK